MPLSTPTYNIANLTQAINLLLIRMVLKNNQLI